METSSKAFVLGARSLANLKGVDERLVRVVERAIQLTPVDFTVIEGVRTQEQCRINYGKGRTAADLARHGIAAKYAVPSVAKVTWLSNPYASKHCQGLAVDLLPATGWNNLKSFDQVAAAMRAAAKELGIAIRWGADWDNDGRSREKGESDSPHFELG